MYHYYTGIDTRYYLPLNYNVVLKYIGRDVHMS